MTVENIKKLISESDADELKEIKNQMSYAIDIIENLKISNVIKERIIDNNKNGSDKVTFRCNDNISEFINEGEIDALIDEVAEKMQGVLESLIIDTANDHNTIDTANRVAKMMVLEIFGGRYSPPPKITAFPNMGYDGLYTAGPISIHSTCAHHFQNIVGKAWVGVVPGDCVIGLSKFNRIVHHIAYRPQIQEEMTTQIASALKEFAQTEDIAVIVKAEHHCMTSRGVREHSSDMCTTYLGGKFKEIDAIRAEFYSLIQSSKSFSE